MKLAIYPVVCFALAAVGLAQDKTEKTFESLECDNSSAIEFAHFYPGTERLEMAFKSRPEKVYTYAYFPRDVWLMWNAADSKGKFYLLNIKGQTFKRPEKSGSDKGDFVIGIEE